MHVDNFVRTSRIMIHLTNLSPVKFIQLFEDKVEIVYQNPQIFPWAKKKKKKKNDTRMSSIAIRRSLRMQIKWTNRSRPKKREREKEDQCTRPSNERKAIVFNELLIRGLCNSEFLFERSETITLESDKLMKFRYSCKARIPFHSPLRKIERRPFKEMFLRLKKAELYRH